MTEIKMLKDAGGRKAGDSAEVHADVASHLIDAGYAEAVEVEAKSVRNRKRSQSQTVDNPVDNSGGGDSSAE